MKRSLLPFFVLLLAQFAIQAQTDTVFWFAPPDLEISHQQTPIRFCFTTYEHPATVTLSQPANSGFTPITINIAADSFFIYDVSSMVDIMETKPVNTIINRGMHISSTTPVSCYYESVGNNSEIYTLKGKNALGTDFLVPMQTQLYNYYSSSTSSIELIATEDSTIVQITAPVGLQGGIAPGSTITIVLQRGQSYAIRSNSTNAAYHLQNTYIHASKPIAVNTTDDSVYASGCFDLIGDQLVPVSMVGNRYVALRNNSSYEHIFIYPVENQTSVSINGVQQTMLNIGQGLNYAIPSNSVANLIESDKPVVVFQMTAIGCELGGTMLPQIECTGSHKVTHLRPSSSTAIFTILVGTAHTSNFVLNGNANAITASDFSPVPGDSSLSYCVKNVSNFVPEGHVMTLQNDAGRFHLGIMDGTQGGDCSYGYFSDYSSASYLYFDMDSLYCKGDTVTFNFLAPNVSNVVLTCPNGQQLTNPPFVFTDADTSLNGRYFIDGVDTSSCFVSFADSIYIRIKGEPSTDTLVVVVNDQSLPYTLNGTSYAEAGVYSQHLTNSSGCDSLLVLYLYQRYEIDLDSVVCENLLPITWHNRQITAAGSYPDTLTSVSGTDSIVTLNLQLLPLPDATIVGSPYLCVDSTITISTANAVSYHWSTGAATQSISVNTSGNYSVTITDEHGCKGIASHVVSSSRNPILTVNAPTFCTGGSYSISVGHEDTNTVVLGAGQTTLSLTDTVFLPDGVPCDPHGCSYRSPLTFSAYGENDVVQSEEDIYYVRLNLEHSWVGDIYINITCPNGQKADIMKYGGSGSSSCNAQILPTSRGWQSGSNAGVGSYFGQAYNVENTSQPCNANAPGNQHGTGWNYCWSNNTTQGYVYAPGVGSLIYRSANEHNGILDSSNVAAGTHFYHPDQSFSSLIGCPLNGSWYIEVIDGWNIDNGYIFGWELALRNEVFSEDDATFTDADASGPFLTTVSDSLFTLNPPASILHDTTVVYSITINDDFGCHYDTSITVTYYAQPHTYIDTLTCGAFVWDNTTYTEPGQYERTFTSVHGCDSIVTLNLQARTAPHTYDTLVLVQNQLPYTFTPHDTVFGTNSPAQFSFDYNLQDGYGCDSTISLTVIVHFNTSQSFDTTVCAAHMPYVWHGISFEQPGSYTRTYINANGSDNVVTYNIHADSLSATITDTTHIICEGDSTGAITGAALNGTPPYTYLWQYTEAGVSTNIGTSAQVSNLPQGTYQFFVTDALGCSAVKVVQLITLNVAPEAGTIADDQALCIGNALETFIGTGAYGGGNNGNYQWQISTDGNNFTTAPGTSNTQNYTYPDNAGGGFLLRRAWISESCGTVYSDTLTVTVGEPAFDTIVDGICLNQSYHGHGFDIPAEEIDEPGMHTFERIIPTALCDSTVTLQLLVGQPSETSVQDEICEGDGYYRNGFSIARSETIGTDVLERTITLQGSNGCDSTLNLHLEIIDTSLHIVALTDDFCEDMTAVLIAVSNMPNYVWNTGDQLDQIFITEPGVYSVTASQGPCASTALVTVKACEAEIILPNAISPTKLDGTNDCFFIPEYVQRFISEFEITIYNRWGEVVYHSDDKAFKWYGDYKGKVYRDTVYSYFIRYKDLNGKLFRMKGAVTVL